MRKQKEPKQPAGISEEFVNIVNGSSAEERKAMIVQIQTQLEESESFLKNKQEILDLKEELKMAQGPTKDTIKVLKNRTKYLLEQLRQQGAL